MSWNTEPWQEDIFLVRVCNLSSGVLTIWDHLVTLDWEVELIWGKPWSTSGIMYLVIRLLGDSVAILNFILDFLLKPSTQLCLRYLHVLATFSQFVTWTGQIVLACRVAALYNRSGKIHVPVILSAVFAAIVASSVGAGSHARLRVTVDPFPGTGIRFCSPIFYPGWTSLLPLPMFLFDFLLFVLAVSACLKELDHIRLIRRHWSRQSIFSILLRDCVYYAISLVVTVTWPVIFHINPAYGRLPNGFCTAAICITVSRLVLNLQHTFYKQQSEGSIWAVIDGLGDLSELPAETGGDDGPITLAGN